MLQLRNDREMEKDGFALQLLTNKTAECKGTRLVPKGSLHGKEELRSQIQGLRRFQHPQERSQKSPEVPEPLGALGSSKDGAIPGMGIRSSSAQNSGSDIAPGTAKRKA